MTEIQKLIEQAKRTINLDLRYKLIKECRLKAFKAGLHREFKEKIDTLYSNLCKEIAFVQGNC